MAKLGARIKDWAANLFVGAEARGVFPKMAAFQRDLSDYPELKVLEENYPVIRAECEALLARRLALPGMDQLTDYTAGGIHQIAWKSFMFKSGGFLEDNCRLAPRTARLLRGIPGVYTAFFSVLEPHQHIKPHWGYWKGFVRYHLGVVIPDDNREKKCWIRINADAWDRDNREAIAQGQTYHWRNGEAVLFDDTFLHDACNDSDQVRVVLFLDVARKMAWPLALLNRVFLWIAHRTEAVRQIRENATVKA